jgi:hypothetical protein
MRLGLLGPAHGDPGPLERAARRLLDDLGADRIVYLGVDGALDRIVQSWAEALVGEEPTDAGIWTRAVRVCASATAEGIDRFIDAEEQRRRLRILQSLPDDSTRAVEMLAGAVAVMVYDKATLTEEDMLPARLLLFGKSRQPMVRQVGQRWFLAPGNHDQGGTLLLEDDDESLTLVLYDAAGAEQRRERLVLGKTTRMKVSSASA